MSMIVKVKSIGQTKIKFKRVLFFFSRNGSKFKSFPLKIQLKSKKMKNKNKNISIFLPELLDELSLSNYFFIC